MKIVQKSGFAGGVLSLVDLILLNSLWVYMSLDDGVVDVYCEIPLWMSLNGAWLATAYFFHIYDIKNLLEFAAIAKEALIAVTFSFALCVLSLLVSNISIDRSYLIEYFSILFISLLMLHCLYSFILRRMRRKGYFFSRFLIAGSGLEAMRIKNYLDSEQGFGQKFLGHICINRQQEEELDHRDVYGTYDSLKKAIAGREIDALYWALPREFNRQYKEVINLCEEHLVRLHIVPHDLVSPLRNLQVTTFDGLPVMRFRKEPLENFYCCFFKRAFDVTVSLAMVVFVLSWLTPLIAIIIKITSKGPVFELCDYMGENRHSYTVMNFRTKSIKDENKLSVTGKFLRRWYLHKLPEFFGCLSGNMSIVGPMPRVFENYDELEMATNQFMVRHLIKPGMVSWAWVCGVEEEKETHEDLQVKVECDVWYIENWSLWLDFKICFYSLMKIFREGRESPSDQG